MSVWGITSWNRTCRFSSIHTTMEDLPMPESNLALEAKIYLTWVQYRWEVSGFPNQLEGRASRWSTFVGQHIGLKCIFHVNGISFWHGKGRKGRPAGWNFHLEPLNIKIGSLFWQSHLIVRQDENRQLLLQHCVDWFTQTGGIPHACSWRGNVSPRGL